MTNQEYVITKRTSKGEATIRIGQYCGKPVILFDLNGKNVNCFSCHASLIGTLKTPITAKSGEVCRHNIGLLALTDSETEILRSAIVAAREDHEATPEAKAEKLRQQRHNLLCAIRGSVDDWSAHRERCFRQDTGLHGMAPFETKVAAAEQALAEFDTAHPEVIAAIEAEKAEAGARKALD
jgi:hypothetical protein